MKIIDDLNKLVKSADKIRKAEPEAKQIREKEAKSE